MQLRKNPSASRLDPQQGLRSGSVSPPMQQSNAIFADSVAATVSASGVTLDASEIFQEARILSTGGNGASTVVVADVNADGRVDLIVANTCVSGSACSGLVAGSVGVLLGNSDGTFQSPLIYFTNSTVVYTVAVADVNGDGKTDILVGTAPARTGIVLTSGLR